MSDEPDPYNDQSRNSYSSIIHHIRAAGNPHLWQTVHAVIATIFSFTYVYGILDDFRRGFSPLSSYIYLTHWNLTAQVVYSNLEFFTDYSTRLRERTTVFRSRLFHCIVFPMSCFVATYFWALHFIDDTLVLPEDPNERNDLWYNHVVHTWIVPAIILQSNASYHRIPSSIRRSMAITAIFGVMYIFWIIAIGALTHKWPYGLIEKRPIIEVAIALGFGVVLTCVFNKLGRWYHKRIWYED